jgi:hypothetical protein
MYEAGLLPMNVRSARIDIPLDGMVTITYTTVADDEISDALLKELGKYEVKNKLFPKR